MTELVLVFWPGTKLLGLIIRLSRFLIRFLISMEKIHLLISRKLLFKVNLGLVPK